MNIETERELIEKAKKDAMAFGLLFDAYYQQTYRYILRRVGDPATAQDIVAETFLKAFQNIRRFKWQGISISNWFYKIATNELRMYFRKNVYAPKSLELLFENDGFEPISDQDLHEELIHAQTMVERQEKFVAAQKLLVSLPIKYQEVITLRFVEKKKISEIALIINKREGTVKSLLSRGLAKLREQLSDSVQRNEASRITTMETQFVMQPEGSYEE